VDPRRADDLEQAQQQLLVFARELNEVIGEERRRRADAEMALRALQDSYFEMVRTLATVVEMKDTTTRSHLDRTYQYALRLTRRIDPELAQDPAIGYGYILHDIGKIGIPEAILNKPGPLTDEEQAVIETHPLLGVQLVAPIRFLGEATHIIREHHERWDGRGYPQGLSGEDIHLGARIFSVIDAFDAITSHRPYQEALSITFALEEVERAAGTQFDPEVVREFLAMCEEMQLAERDSPEELNVVR
jgi:response regulator RpfG family c-di-GMP phosphodiesterase